MLRFIHISDTHIGPNKDFLYRDKINSYSLSEKLVEKINLLSFNYDFILHTGDVVEDMSEKSYQNAKNIFSKLKKPVYYVNGNHDDARNLQKMLSINLVKDKYDYDFSVNDISFHVFDSKGQIDPGGLFLEDDWKRLENICSKEDEVIIVLHHHPLFLDSGWVDTKGDSWPDNLWMPLKDCDRFQKTLKNGKAKIKAVLFGHIHRAYFVVKDNIIYSSAPSVVNCFESYPNSNEAIETDERTGFSVVTMDDSSTIIRTFQL